jgi:acyl-CoA synthetase (NDP forming)
MEYDHSLNSLKPFFEPGSVAVIGASRTPGKGGYNIIENLLRLGYKGKIYPVNPRAKQILRLPVYAELKQTPEPPELALIVLPPSRVLPALVECADRGIKDVIIESAGFGEMDEKGALEEKEIARLAKQTGIRVLGPNSVGTINPTLRFDASLGRLNKTFLPNADIKPGSVGFVGQTGLFTGVFLPLINSDLGISKIACLGNKCDVDESDLLEYLGDDPTTKIIAMYLESIKDGHRFLSLSRRIIKEKPIIILKSAITERGARASTTHTGSVAGEDRVYDAAFKQSGIVRVESFARLWDVTKAFVYSPLPKGNRVAIINLAGSGCVTAVDACVRNGLKIAELSPTTADRVKTVYPDWWRVRSPIDVWTAIEASGFKVTYTTITTAVLEDKGVDAVVVVMGANDWIPGKDVPKLFKEIKKKFPDKPFLTANPLGDRKIYERMCQGFQSLGIPSYTSAEDAIVALAAQYHYQRYRRMVPVSLEDNNESGKGYSRKLGRSSLAKPTARQK